MATRTEIGRRHGAIIPTLDRSRCGEKRSGTKLRPLQGSALS